MQDTINYFHAIDPQLLAGLEVLGAPTPVDLESGLKYYKYEIQ